MKNALKLFITDLKRVAKTPAVWVILAGLAILPSFYAWFNLWAMWDPYSHTGHIKVAVVNEDKGDKVRGKKINVGNTLEDNLKKNDKFDWQFVSREKADHEIKMGKYYAGIYIPKEFSHQITGTLRKKPQKADIEYKVNQKINAVAPKMTDTGSTVIVDEANKQFNETVTKALLQEANKVGIQLEDEVPTINKIKNAVYAAHDSLPQINKIADRIEYLNDHQDDLDKYANQFRALGNYKGDILDAQQKLNDVNAAIPSLNEKAKLILALNEYMPNIEKLLDVASNDIPAQFPKINRGVDIASEGLDLANTRLNDAQGYLTSAQQRVGDYQEAAGRAQEVNNQANSALRQQSTSGLPQYQIQKLSTDSSQDTVNDNQIVSNNDVKSMNSALAEALLTLSSNSDNQAKATQSDIKALKDISYGVIGSNRPTEFNDMLRNLKTRLENSSKSNQQLIDVLKELEKREHVDLSSQIKQVESANNRISDSLRSTNQLIDALKNGSSGKAEAVKLLRSLPDLNKALGNYRDFIKNDLNNRLLVVSNQITQELNKGQNTLSDVQSKLNTINRVIIAGQDIVTDGQNRIANIQSELPALEQTYINAMQTAQKYFPTVKKDVANAADFVRNDLPDLEQQLANATATVNTNLPTLFNKYDNAVDLLNQNQPRAKEALANLANFSENRLPDIEKDLNKANKIFKKLDEDDAVDKVIDALKNDLKKQADVIANPIHKKQVDVFPVKDYGSGMTPFYTSLSIWVGALLLVSLLSVDNKHEALKDELTKRQIYLGKGAFFIMMGIIQTLIVTIGDLVILKAQVESPTLFILVALCGAIVFNTIVYTCVSLLGNPGKAIAIILLVLQIAGGGGTFPVVTAPKFFQTISPYLPFTYVIDSLRETVGGIVPEILITKMIILILFGLGFFILGILVKPVLDPIMRKISKRVDESNVTE
ncbi:YhgE/Pip domain-containing protein [Staphylococcus haemolyticus]|uniref:YhgE/Pip domain-containing protein n=1 Tax=Staphylococcus haemolyticus TaxID=1283 RepID=UPI002901B390|nr:YhgE/Pip domain-containing protein [Staphylococcus haemolyticus]MDU0422344.1 YhgE/Pip domain-containing protein [Staphylococcus haemolyticus]MDU0442635.1 YhgE/Pip domain-containing protein [Staphylococcus haemolyticus]MDU0474758.1 YhgE/Pip domain-containing protein [Staphylococcus haemolyticus]